MSTHTIEPLSEADVEALNEIRARLNDSVAAIVAIGSRGWNHGPKVIKGHGDAIQLLRHASAALIETTHND